MPALLDDPATGSDQQPAAVAPPLQQPTVYDPNNPTPYQPVPTQQVIPQPFQPPPEQEVPNMGAAGHAGAISYIGDKLLRGYMAGSAQKQVRDAVSLQRQQTAAAQNYDTTAQRLISMKQAGADKSTPDEWQAAVAQKDAAYKALTDMWDQHVQKMTTDPKTGKQVPAKGNLLQRMFNHQDPMQVAPAWVEAMKANGAPVDHVLAQMDTPGYQAQIAARAQQRGLQAQTGDVTADVGLKRAQAQQDYLNLSHIQNPTPEQAQQRDQAYQTMLMLPNDKGGISPIATKTITWTPVAGPQQVQKVPGTDDQYGFMMKNGLGQLRVQPIPGLHPSTADQKGLIKYEPDPKTGTWVQFQQDRFGQEVPNSRRPAPFAGRTTIVESSTADNAGNSSNTQRSTTIAPLSITPGGEGGGTRPAPVQPQGTSPAAAAPHASANPAAAAAPPQHAAAAPSAATSSTPTAAQLPPHAAPASNLGPGSKLNYPGALPLNSPGSPTPSIKPSDPSWEPNPNDPAQIWANNLYMHSDKYKPSDVPANPKYLKNAVQQFMSANGMVAGDQDTMAERQMIHSMRDGYPKIDEAIGLLEHKMGITPDMSTDQKRQIAKEHGGFGDMLGQRISAKAYNMGIVPGGEDSGVLESKINQITALDSLIGTTPWTKIGRSMRVFNAIQKHVPNYETDSPGAMYNKLTELKDIFDTNMTEYAKRHNQPGGTAAANGQATTTPAQTARPQGVPSNYVQFKDSNGDAHFIDPSKLSLAKQRDPGLTVIQ